MLFSEARGRKVVSSSTASTVGKVSRLVIDPTTRAVAGVQLKKKTDRGDMLRWSDITAFGADAVTVTDADRVGDGGDTVQALSGKAHRVLGKRLLTSTGDELGKVADVDFDPVSGVLTALHVDDESVVDAAGLLGIGSYAVVVRDER
jgi:sporulation protein YlmC with PRC-barrel domain